jgi:hypothetical protein
MLLSGSLLEAPPNAEVMVTGAVCITMHPVPTLHRPGTTPVTGPDSHVAGNDAPSSPSSPASSDRSSWIDWLFELLFSK